MTSTTGKQGRDSIPAGESRYVPAADDFKGFKRRYLVFEEKAGSDFHIPDDTDRPKVCEFCGRRAWFSEYIFGMKTEVKDSNPNLEKVKASYEIFEFPVCLKCFWGQAGEGHPGPRWMTFVLFNLVILLFALAVLFLGTFSFKFWGYYMDEPDVEGWASYVILSPVILLPILVGAGYLLKGIFNRPRRIGRIHERNWSRMIRKMEQLSSEGWAILHDSREMSTPTLAGFIRSLDDSYGPILWFHRDKNDLLQQVAPPIQEVYEIDKSNYVDEPSPDPNLAVCSGCGKTTRLVSWRLFHRHVLARFKSEDSNSSPEGIAHEYGKGGGMFCIACETRSRIPHFGETQRSDRGCLIPFLTLMVVSGGVYLLIKMMEIRIFGVPENTKLILGGCGFLVIFALCAVILHLVTRKFRKKQPQGWVAKKPVAVAGHGKGESQMEFHKKGWRNLEFRMFDNFLTPECRKWGLGTPGHRKEIEIENSDDDKLSDY